LFFFFQAEDGIRDLTVTGVQTCALPIYSGEAVGFPRIDERQDVRVLELRREADLSEKPLGTEDGGKLRAEHFERDGAVVLEISGEIDRGHPAAAELALDRVTTREGRTHALEEVGHVAQDS